MDFTYDDEQIALREAVRSLARRAYGDFENRRRAVKDDPGFNETVWRSMAEMGLLGLPFPEEDGGVGAGPIEVGIVCQELGRVIAPEPYLTSVVQAGGLVQVAGTDVQRKHLLGELSSGEIVLAFAHAEPGRDWSSSAKTVTASQDGDTWSLSGIKEPVPHGARADHLVVSAALPTGGTGLFLVDGAAASRTSFATYDGTRAARVVLDATDATPLGEPGVDATAAIENVQNMTRVMAANQALGAMQSALSQTTAYLKSRKQFGVTLSTFQALTFRAADMYISVELAQSQVDWATMVAERASRDGSVEALADAARRSSLEVSRRSRHVGQEAIQLHGGIAMTAEYATGNVVAHLTLLDHLFGDAAGDLAQMANGVLDYPALEPLAASTVA